ncbi:hypothetical protein AB1Y20_010043 [Prymnesium parvum]|uniref:Uncharacterized protein n=1 Tax=Prymnesium parvum TaxID=97485 RepID=A0AB34K3W4_PRYPA
MSERYASWSTADHAYALEHVDGVSVLGAAAGGCRTAPSTAPTSHKRRQRSLELRAVLDGPLRLSKLPGSGSEQAPEVLSLLVDAGFRAVHQSSPPGVAIFTDTKPDTEIDLLSPEHALLRLMLALDPAHAAYEEQYSAYERRRLLCRRLASRILALRPRMQLDAQIAPLLEAAPETDDALEGVVSSTIRAVAEPMGVSVHQLEREWERLVTVHSTLANSCLERFCAATGVHLQDATLMVSQQPARERILLLLYDRVVHEVQQWPRPFSWVPSLSKVLEMRSAERLGQAATESLWEELRKGGFWPSSALRDQLRPLFEGWFRTCFMTHGGIPLRAALSPKQPLCLYLHGTAGSGKSSLVRSLLPAIACAVRGWLNPGLQAGFVKQGLNKEISALNLEFERRPNNNDLSVVSVVEMAREPLAAVSPKLLLLGLEEMPASAADGAATAHEERSGLERAASQEEAAALLAERFSKTVAHPDMIVAFSSNYELCAEAHAKLRKCPLFSGVLPVFVRPVDGGERRDLARQLIRRRMLELLKDCQAKAGPATLAIEVTMRLGEGDVRPLVRELRAVAAFAIHRSF